MTGGAGFIGSHLVTALQRSGAAVSVVDDLSSGRRERLPGVSFHQLSTSSPDLAEVFRAEAPQVVFHLAANTDVPASVRDPLADCANVHGSLNVFRLAAASGVRKVVLASSTFVYGAVGAADLPLTEDHPVQPVSPYAVSKIASELYLLYFHRHHGMPATIFRYGTVYGPGQTGGAMADYIRTIAAGRSAEIYGDGSMTRDYTYVSDVVRANLLALPPRAADGMVINLGSDRETRLLDLYLLLAKLLDEPRNRPLLSAPREGDIARLRVSYDRARRVLGWEPRVDLIEGLRATVRAAREIAEPSPAA